MVHWNTLVLRPAHDRRHHFVGLPERHAGPDQIVGQIRGKKLWIECSLDVIRLKFGSADGSFDRGQHYGERVHGIEEHALVFLQVAVVPGG